VITTDIAGTTASWFLSGSITGASGAGARPHRAYSWRMSYSLDCVTAVDEEKGEQSRVNHLGCTCSVQHVLRLEIVSNIMVDRKAMGLAMGQYASSRRNLSVDL
jgi:hypothetical protein